MDCLCRPYDPDMFGETYGVIRHRGARRQINLFAEKEAMLLSSWKYWKARGLESPFDRGKKEIPALVAEPELRSQLVVPPPVVETIPVVITANKKDDVVKPRTNYKRQKLE